MLSDNELKEILLEYSELRIGIKRKAYVDKIMKYVDRRETIVIKGIRRSGKSTIMRQVISELEGKHCVFVNLDDYRFLEYKSIELLEKILQLSLGSDRLYLFLDEIQTIPKFESWIRTHYDKETNVKFVISGSNSSLISKDLGTLLTGRVFTFEVAPLTYKEFLDFSEGDLGEYLEYGGFPEVVLEKDKERKKELLVNYFDTIVEKDIISKYGINNSKQLRELLKYLLSNPGVRVSFNKLAKQLGLSVNTVKSYLSLAEDVYLIFEVPFFSYSAKTKFIGFRVSKYYSIDYGFAKIFTSRFEKSKAYENTVAMHFFKKRKDLYYWREKNEVDFVIDAQAINVVASKKIPEREFMGLKEVREKHRFIKKEILVSEETVEEISVSLKEFLLA